MIICPNCLHQNANGTTACEVCQTPLPSASSCPNCGGSIQSGAQFCGQCGCNLATVTSELDDIIALTADKSEPIPSSSDNPFLFPEPQPPDPLIMPDLMGQASESLAPSDPVPPVQSVPDFQNPPFRTQDSSKPSPSGNPRTQLQQQTIQLIHVQTNTVIDLPPNQDLMHMGKPNDRVPPDIDVSGFPNAEVVSRVHANIRVEGGHYYIEDVGSSNGTYINNIPLLPGNRHRLRIGDRIALGKGNLVTFLFQLN